MEKTKIAVIFGGKSTEHEVSNISGTAVIKNLNKEKYEIYPIYINKKGEWFSYNEEVRNIDVFKMGEEPTKIQRIESINNYLSKMDVIFPVLHGLYGEDGTIIQEIQYENINNTISWNQNRTAIVVSIL